jgi:hypothetical protein
VDTTNSYNLDGTYDFRGGDSNVSGGSDTSFDTSSSSLGGSDSTSIDTSSAGLGGLGGSTVIDDGTSGVVSGLTSTNVGVPNVTIEGNGINEFYTYPELGGSTSLQDQAGGIGSVDSQGGFTGGTLTPSAGDAGTVGSGGIGDVSFNDFGGGGGGDTFAYSDFGGGGGGGGGGKYYDDFSYMAYARGGATNTINGLSDLGSYSDGGRLLRGPGDGVSDSIPAVIGNKQPARLADGEFVIPARIVSELGNGSTEAGARKLYAMMERIQATRKHSVGKGKVAKNTRADRHLPA